MRVQIPLVGPNAMSGRRDLDVRSFKHVFRKAYV